MKKINHILKTSFYISLVLFFFLSPTSSIKAATTDTTTPPKAIPVSAADQAAYEGQLKNLYTGYPGGKAGQSPMGGAAAGCVGNFVGSWVGGKIGGIVESVTSLSVPVNDGQANFREQTLNGIAFCIGNALITAVTQSTVQWINNGFKNPDGTSGPSFLSNPSGFFKQLANQEVGGFFQGLGPIGSILCKPFDLTIRLSLLNEYNRKGMPLCTLDTIKQNFDRFGQNGNYMGDWFKLTQQNQNNAMGSYFNARDQMSDAIKYNLATNKAEIDLGKGFLDLKKCKKYSTTNKDPNSGKAKCDVWEHTTPGAEVQAGLDRALGINTSRLALATNFNQIISALANQIVIMAMKGLSGASANDYNYTPINDMGNPEGGATGFETSTTTSTNTTTTSTSTQATFDTGSGVGASTGASGSTNGSSGSGTNVDINKQNMKDIVASLQQQLDQAQKALDKISQTDINRVAVYQRAAILNQVHQIQDQLDKAQQALSQFK